MRTLSQELTSLPNIGPEAAQWLAAAGIRTPAELRAIGSVAAAQRIRSLRPEDPPCRSMLSGLEGAIRGIRWHAIPRQEREALWEQYQAVRRGASPKSGRKNARTGKRA